MNHIDYKRYKSLLDKLFKDYKISKCQNTTEFLDKNSTEQISIVNSLITQCRKTAKYKDTVDQLTFINEMIEKRCLDFNDNKKTVLNSLLERDYKKIVIDKLIHTNIQGNQELITDPNEIKSIVKNHFKSITNIEDNITKNLMDE